MKLFKRLFCCSLSLLLLAACSGASSETQEPASGQSAPSSEGIYWKEAPSFEIPAPVYSEEEVRLIQFDTEAARPHAVLKTSMGDIEVMLFPEEAPKAVENFLTHAKEGYYNGISFHRVIKDFMIQGGDPNGDGTGGESIWGQSFEDEFSDDLHNFRGALCMANAGYHTNGSQFFIVQTGSPVTDKNAILQQNYFYNAYNQAMDRIWGKMVSGEVTQDNIMDYLQAEDEALNKLASSPVPESYVQRMQPVVDKYAEVGGAYWLDYKHTVFGQVVSGMDVVDKIAAVEVDAASKPVTGVIIESIEVKE